MDFGEQRRWSFADAGLYLLGIAGLSASITVMFVGMRAVLDVGGYPARQAGAARRDWPVMFGGSDAPRQRWFAVAVVVAVIVGIVFAYWLFGSLS